MTMSLVRNGTLIDGSGAPPLRGAAVLVKDGRIHAIGPRAGIGVSPGSFEDIDAEGGCILPGFIDAHVHLVLEGINLARDMATPFSMRFYRSVEHMRRTLDAGITTVRDAAGADLGMKTAVEKGLVPGPRMQISISMLSQTGGHVDFWMRSGNEFRLLPPYPGFPDGRCDGVDGVRQRVREVLRAGADVIKVCATGEVLSPTDHSEFTRFSPEELDVIVREAAYRRSTKVMAHAQGVDGIKNALRAGVHSIEHGIYLDDEAIGLMLERGAFLVPTLLAPVAVLEIGQQGGMAEHAVEKARAVIDAHRDSIARAHRAGLDVSRARLLGRRLERRDETPDARPRLPVRHARAVLRRSDQYTLPARDGEDRRRSRRPPPERHRAGIDRLRNYRAVAGLSARTRARNASTPRQFVGSSSRIDEPWRAWTACSSAEPAAVRAAKIGCDVSASSVP